MPADTPRDAEKVLGESRFVCPDYDGVPQYGGPCWTCQGVEEQCPMTARNDGPEGGFDV